MGAYITSAEVVTRVGNAAAVRLTTDTGSTVDSALIDTFIVEVEGDINAAVSKRSDAAITQALYPSSYAALKGKAMAMTVYRLAGRRPPVSEDWKAANDAAVEWLDKLVKGERDFPDSALNGSAMEWGGNDPNAAKLRDL